MADLIVSRRVRSTPYLSRLEAYGVAAYSVYNHMVLPVSIRGVETDYWHLREAVQIWDVSCQRQVEISGREAARLAQLLTVRDLSRLAVGRCAYAPVVDDRGGMINDPLVVRIARDRWWFSIADSDLALWAEGLAHGYGIDAQVSEPDVWPLALQGPKADDVAARLFGEEVRNIRFFGWQSLRFRGRPLIIARSGWSVQGGFEFYVDDAEMGGELYDSLMEAGEDFEIGPGTPNLIERIEGGLLSYGSDMTRGDSALESGLDQYCSLASNIEAVGLSALRDQAAAGLSRQIRGLAVEGPAVPPVMATWPLTADGHDVGWLTSAVWSPRLEINVALGMVRASHWGIGTVVNVHAPDGGRVATVVALPFPGSHPGK